MDYLHNFRCFDYISTAYNISTNTECLVWGISIMHGEPNVTLFFILLYFGVAIIIIGLMWWGTR